MSTLRTSSKSVSTAALLLTLKFLIQDETEGEQWAKFQRQHGDILLSKAVTNHKDYLKRSRPKQELRKLYNDMRNKTAYNSPSSTSSFANPQASNRSKRSPSAKPSPSSKLSQPEPSPSSKLSQPEQDQPPAEEHQREPSKMDTDQISNITRTPDQEIIWELPEKNIGILPFRNLNVEYKGEDIDMIHFMTVVVDPNDVLRTRLFLSKDKKSVELQVSI